MRLRSAPVSTENDREEKPATTSKVSKHGKSKSRSGQAQVFPGPAWRFFWSARNFQPSRSSVEVEALPLIRLNSVTFLCKVLRLMPNRLAVAT
jgi:hypothetical protein